MNTMLRRAADRGQANHGWLYSQHTFSFADYFDPRFMGFSDLRVINEDRVAPGRGFGAHGHRDMEIVSYVLEGSLGHRDSMGNGSLIRPGDVQLMSAGRGVTHSEMNGSPEAPVHFLQIWIEPNVRGGAPGYQQRHFPYDERRGRLRLIVSPDGEDDSLVIHQDARVYTTTLEPGQSITHVLAEKRATWLHLARGAVQVNEQTLQRGDAWATRDAGTLTVEAVEPSELLVFDLRADASADEA